MFLAFPAGCVLAMLRSKARQGARRGEGESVQATRPLLLNAESPVPEVHGRTGCPPVIATICLTDDRPSSPSRKGGTHAFARPVRK